MKQERVISERLDKNLAIRHFPMSDDLKRTYTRMKALDLKSSA